MLLNLDSLNLDFRLSIYLPTEIWLFQECWCYVLKTDWSVDGDFIFADF